MKRLTPHIIGLALAVPFGYAASAMIFDATVPVVVIHRQTPIYDHVPPGGVQYIALDLTRLRSCPAVLYQWIFDSRDQQFAVAPIVIAPRSIGADRVTIEVPIPGNAAAGPARYQLSYTHTCEVLDGYLKNEHGPFAMPYVTFRID